MVTVNMLRTHEGNVYLSEENKIRFVTALDLIKCLKQDEYQRLPLTCAPISELPSNTSTVTRIVNYLDCVQVHKSEIIHEKCRH